MAETLNDDAWRLLLQRIQARKCTPFLGAGASYGYIPLGGELAKSWAQERKYPLEDESDLPRVAQYLATLDDNLAPKERLLGEFRKLSNQPDYTDEDDTYNILASLPFSTYITTNYDPFMVKALEAHPDKKPRRELCRWNSYLRKNSKSVFETDPQYEPSVGAPLVYHLHGHDDSAESLVLTEDDYLDFLVNMSRDQDLLPGTIQAALGGSTLLFLGYSLRDLNFRVLFRSIVRYVEKSLGRKHVSVQLVPVSAKIGEDQKKLARDYLNRYFRDLSISVYWGTCHEFLLELKTRWNQEHGR